MAEGSPVRAAGAELPARWPGYGRAAARLGIHCVTVMPLHVPAGQLGVLCCYGDGPADIGDFVATTATVAAALTPMLLRAAPAVFLPALIDARQPAAHIAN